MAEDGDSPVATYTVTVSGEGVQVERLLDRDTALQVIALVVGGALPSSQSSSSPRERKKRGATRSKGGVGEAAKPQKRRSGTTAVLKDLSMRPAGKKAFKDFASEKRPKSHQQKQAVALQWLLHEAGIAEGVTPEHVNTCYKEAGWTRPANLENSLQVTAGRQGWLDTSDMSNIKLTTRGEDFVTYELPEQKQEQS